MKKTILALALMLACALVLTGCQCEHQWKDANCTAPKTCTRCGEFDGAPLGHSWLAATCTEPKTCEICKTTSGEELGHKWIEATCTEPKFCEICKTTASDAMGHTWQDATTQAPKTCTACGETEGERIITDSRFTTDVCQSLFGSWGSSREFTAADLGLTDRTNSYTETLVYTFRNDGTLTVGYEIDDPELCKALMIASTMKTLRADYESDEAADQAMQAQLGMTVEEYATQYAEAFLKEIEDFAFDSVYYVSEETLYIGNDWDSEMEQNDFFFVDESTLRIIDGDGDHIDLTAR